MAQEIEKILTSFSRDDEEREAQASAKRLNLPYINLVSYPIVPDVLNLISEDSARRNSVVAYLRIGKKLRVATGTPGQEGSTKLLAELKAATGYEPVVALCSASSLAYALALYRTLPKSAPTQEKVAVTQGGEAAQLAVADLGELKEKIGSVPTTKLLDIIFAGATAAGASDIHLEPTAEDLRLRFRIDGVLEDVVALPAAAYKTLRARIKYLAKLKLDVTERPQDGRFDAEAGGQPIDVRVSTLPASFGEIITMRLLLHDQALLTLEKLGIRPQALADIQTAIKKPNGIILNTGPTGSGKTTTLYSILNALNRPGVKIITLEDPIEYRIKGIDQSQVDPSKDYTFATALRSALRQDPDIIMVGEIRDSETADIAVHAALTGHLVLTTLHTNNAAATLPRLIDMGVAPFLLAGSINLIIAQRLVRRVCQVCKGKGGPECNLSGYKGRIAIMETLVPNDEIDALILKKASLTEFEAAAKRAGMVAMLADGLEKAQAGLTTREEVLRVVEE